MKLKTFIRLFALGGFFLAACEDANYSTLDNRVYIDEAIGLNQQISALTIDGDVTFELTVRLAHATDRDVTVRLGMDEKLVSEYNVRQGTSYEIIPSEYVTFEKEVIIPAGKTTADPLQVTVRQYKSSGVPYALPIRIVDAEGSPVMSKTGRMLYLLSAPHIQKAVRLSGSSRCTKTFATPIAASKWTLEFWISVSDFTSRYKIFDGCNIVDFGGGFFMRYWNPGATKVGPCLQWQTDNGYFDSSEFWKQQTWYHVAYVSDGSKVSLYIDGELDVAKDLATSPTFKSLSFANGSYSWSTVMVNFAQIRLWTTALSQGTIKDAMNREVAADSEGLAAYWKCDEGQGNVLKDATGNGNDITLGNTPSWTEELNFSHLK